MLLTRGKGREGFVEQAQGMPLGMGMAVGVEGCFDIGRY